MCRPEVDVMVQVGSSFTPGDVMGLLARIVSRPGVTGLDYRDERGPHCVSGQVRDERYHVPLSVEHAGRCWQIDLTLWLHDPHVSVTRWHEDLRERITADRGVAALRCQRRLAPPGPPTRNRSAACRSTPRSSRAACAPQANSPPGSPGRDCQRPSHAARPPTGRPGAPGRSPSGRVRWPFARAWAAGRGCGRAARFRRAWSRWRSCRRGAPR